MTLNLRTKISLTQLLEIFEYDFINVLFEKYSLPNHCQNITDIKNILIKKDIDFLIKEIVSTQKDLRSRISPKYKFEERWEDFTKCLFLDGYKITENNTIISIEPEVTGIVAMEDELTNEIKKSSLSKKDAIVKLIIESEEAFKNASPDYNGCLSKARISLETMVKDIANNNDCSVKCWGRSLNILKENTFITNDEEQAISSTYTFVSDGSHIPLGFTEEEYARYGRNLIMTVCYFIIKKQNNTTEDEPF